MHRSDGVEKARGRIHLEQRVEGWIVKEGVRVGAGGGEEWRAGNGRAGKGHEAAVRRVENVGPVGGLRQGVV